MPDDPRRHPARTAVLTGLVGGSALRRVFVDATGTPVPLPAAVRTLVATDPDLGALVRGTGATLAGCAGVLDGVRSVGEPGRPDPAAVAACRPDVVVAGTGLDPRLAAALTRVAPVVTVDAADPAAAADLRALVGSVKGPPPLPPAPEVVIPPPYLR